MTVYSTVLCGVPVSHRKRIESLVCMGRRMMPSTLQRTVRENITAAFPLAQQKEALAWTGWSHWNLKHQNTQKSSEMATFLPLRLNCNAYSKAALCLCCISMKVGFTDLDLQGELAGMPRAIGILCKKPTEVSTLAIEHSCRADRVLSWDLVNISSVSDCILMKVFYFSAEFPNCNVTR